MAKHKKLICLDFDGVIHSYTSGWQGPRVIPDPPVDGAIEWITYFIDYFCDVPDSICAMTPEGVAELGIFSTRSRYWGGRLAIKRWLVDNGLDRRYLEVIKFPLFKPPAFVTIDDRVVCFNGTFPKPTDLLSFRSWYQSSKSSTPAA